MALGMPGRGPPGTSWSWAQAKSTGAGVRRDWVPCTDGRRSIRRVQSMCSTSGVGLPSLILKEPGV